MELIIFVVVVFTCIVGESFMSLLPFVSSSLFLAVLMSVFFWKSLILTIFLILSYFISVFYLEEVDSLGIWSRIPGSFAIFIFSEAIVFVSILLAVAWYNSFESLNLTFWNELPVIGTMILFVSSVSVVAYHHSMGSPVGLFNLKLTFWLGVSFIVLQYSEFHECCVCLVDNGYSSSSLCAVGLHLLHVFVGVFSLGFLIKYFGSAVSVYRPGLVVWYWHFVDYVWLVVYFLVYVL